MDMGMGMMFGGGGGFDSGFGGASFPSWAGDAFGGIGGGGDAFAGWGGEAAASPVSMPASMTSDFTPPTHTPSHPPPLSCNPTSLADPPITQASAPASWMADSLAQPPGVDISQPLGDFTAGDFAHSNTPDDMHDSIQMRRFRPR